MIINNDYVVIYNIYGGLVVTAKINSAQYILSASSFRTHILYLCTYICFFIILFFFFFLPIEPNSFFFFFFFRRQTQKIHIDGRHNTYSYYSFRNNANGAPLLLTLKKA
jgi:hypothetical protein